MMKNSSRRADLLYILPRILLLGVFFIYVLFALLTYFDYIERYLFPLHFIQGEVRKIGEGIYMGPYPHLDELKRLKRQTGINVVISLLNTELPQEKALFEREKKIAARLGLELYSRPLTYFSLRSRHNEEMLESIIELIRRNRSRGVYMHCYLGRHRVRFVRDRLVREGIVEPMEY